MSKHEAWLAQVQEEILEPELPICDPHHHLWHYVTPETEMRYLLPDLLADLNEGPGESAHNVVSTVFIECSAMYRADGPEALRPVGETEFVHGIAAMSASDTYGPARVAAGIVGMADLTLGAAVAEVLDAHLQAGGAQAGSGRFRGIRHAAGWHASDQIRNSHTKPPAHLYLDPTFREGFAELGKRGLTFEGWCYHTQIQELTGLARAFPDTTIILDHFGGPLGIGPYAGQHAEVLEEWRPALAELATCPNVVAKLGGINMKVNGFGWHQRPEPPTSQELMEATRPYYEHALACFGVARCMFESNFPMDKVSCGYSVLWNSFKRLTADFSASEKAALYHDNAVRVYRLRA